MIINLRQGDIINMNYTNRKNFLKSIILLIIILTIIYGEDIFVFILDCFIHFDRIPGQICYYVTCCIFGIILPVCGNKLKVLNLNLRILLFVGFVVCCVILNRLFVYNTNNLLYVFIPLINYVLFIIGVMVKRRFR